ncbi:BlaI/MecI/CopY family transcriptional regulator [Gimesia aquarii]|uniref:Penicillinase repressor n=1 Tax=Gimesia aquarii TaxID=2527964 RepID=A0A517W3Y2_9PLAN|nr:BlaI/MecI/CopY family transcriptional regulator [Gimesia aquarii]QDT99971.1 Penicillinase repressor [Gimesia aquarii]
MAKSNSKQPALSPLENAVMQIVWDGQPMTGEDVRERMDGTHGLKASTIRTLLRRLEVKGYVTHDVEGRTYIYRAALEQTNVATSAVRSIVDKFCSGSVENLLVGLVDDKQISSERLQELANQIAATEEKKAKQKKPKRTKRN